MMVPPVSSHVVERFRTRPASVWTLPDRSDLRWTIDAADDLEWVRSVFAGIGDDFDLPEIFDIRHRKPSLPRLDRDVPHSLLD